MVDLAIAVFFKSLGCVFGPDEVDDGLAVFDGHVEGSYVVPEEVVDVFW